MPEGDAAESYSVAKGQYTFQSPVDHGTGAAAPHLAYSTFGGTLESTVSVVDALLKSPDHTLDLLPSGRVHLDTLTTATVSNGKETKTLTAYTLIGHQLLAGASLV